MGQCVYDNGLKINVAKTERSSTSDTVEQIKLSGNIDNMGSMEQSKETWTLVCKRYFHEGVN